MFRIFFKILIIIIINITYIHVAKSELLENLYSVKLPAPDKKDVTRNDLIKQAFVIMLAKVASTTEKFSLPNQSIDDYVNSFSYSSESEKLIIQVNFNNHKVNKYLQELKQPYLNPKRPVIMIWISVNDSSLLQLTEENSEYNKFIRKLEKSAVTRGLPIIFPLLDLTEINQITPDNIMQDEQLLINTTKRYFADVIIAGTISFSTNSWHSQWKLLGEQLGGQSNSWNIKSIDMEEHIELFMDRLVTQLLNQQNQQVIIDKLSVKNNLILNISGINNVESYDKILNYLKNLSMVSHAEITKIANNSVAISLITYNDKYAISKMINSDKILSKTLELEEDNMMQNDNTLYYYYKAIL